jgi:hypothetical protein
MTFIKAALNLSLKIGVQVGHPLLLIEIVRAPLDAT